jgi:hypothetical protein
MSDQRITDLTNASTPLGGSEIVPIVQSATTKQVTLDNLTVGRTVSATTYNATNLEVTNLKAKDGTAAGSIANSTGVVTLSSVDINGGTVDGATIGGSSPAAGTFTTLADSKGNVRKVPQSGSAKTTAYTLATGDVGQFIEVGASGSIVIPNATFAAGDIVSIFNNTTGNITITCTITTAYIAGVDVDEASVDLATRGVATILFLSGTVCVISGNVS